MHRYIIHAISATVACPAMHFLLFPTAPCKYFHCQFRVDRHCACKQVSVLESIEYRISLMILGISDTHVLCRVSSNLSTSCCTLVSLLSACRICCVCRACRLCDRHIANKRSTACQLHPVFIWAFAKFVQSNFHCLYSNHAAIFPYLYVPGKCIS